MSQILVELEVAADWAKFRLLPAHHTRLQELLELVDILTLTSRKGV
jgi:hypothetical protein